MKEAAGEANMTVITIVLIGLVAAAGAILIPNLISNMKDRSCCTQSGGYVDGGNCKFGAGTQWAGNSYPLKGYYEKYKSYCS